MNVIDKHSKVKAVYSPPEFTVRRIQVEGPIAASVDPVLVQPGPEWIEDTSRQPYDGDIWMPI